MHTTAGSGTRAPRTHTHTGDSVCPKGLARLRVVVLDKGDGQESVCLDQCAVKDLAHVVGLVANGRLVEVEVQLEVKHVHRPEGRGAGGEKKSIQSITPSQYSTGREYLA